MSIRAYFKNLFYNRRLKKSGLRFPVACKLRGVSAQDLQGAIIQSQPLDELQIVHCPSAEYPFGVAVYSIPLNRLLGYLDEGLSKKLVYVFGKGFCRDGEIIKRTGGTGGEYYGCNIRIFESMEMMKDCEDFSHLHGA